MDIAEEIKSLEQEIAEYKDLVDKKTNRLNRLYQKQASSIEDIKKKDSNFGKYYKRVDHTVTLYHPQEYGTHYCSFNWENDIVYEGFYCTYQWKGTPGTGFSFDLQYPVHQRHLLSDFVEITKEEFEKEVMILMNDIMEFVKTDKFLPNDKEARNGLYEPAKAKKQWL